MILEEEWTWWAEFLERKMAVKQCVMQQSQTNIISEAFDFVLRWKFWEEDF
jgi:hypothetical protein